MFKKSLFILPLFLTSGFLLPRMALAATQGINVWEKTLSSISTSLTGPVAYSISIIAMVLCGLAMAFTDLQGGSKRFIQAACGLSIAFFSTQIISSFIGFRGALI